MGSPFFTNWQAVSVQTVGSLSRPGNKFLREVRRRSREMRSGQRLRVPPIEFPRLVSATLPAHARVFWRFWRGRGIYGGTADRSLTRGASASYRSSSGRRRQGLTSAGNHHWGTTPRASVVARILCLVAPRRPMVTPAAEAGSELVCVQPPRRWQEPPGMVACRAKKTYASTARFAAGQTRPTSEGLFFFV